MNMLQTLCTRFVERAEHFDMKGKKRDEKAIEFLVGAASALQATDHPEYSHVINCVALIICVRGYAEVKRIADMAKEETPKTPRGLRVVCSNELANA